MSISIALVCGFPPIIVLRLTSLLQGRTARIGNEGLATSLYNHDRDIEIAPGLVKILTECQQPIPDFLADQKPAEGEPLFADDDTDNEGDDGNGDGDAAWGTGAAEPTEPAGGDWDAPAKVATTDAQALGTHAPAPAPAREESW